MITKGPIVNKKSLVRNEATKSCIYYVKNKKKNSGTNRFSTDFYDRTVDCNQLPEQSHKGTKYEHFFSVILFLRFSLFFLS